VQRVSGGLFALVSSRADWPAPLLGRIPATAEERGRLLRSLGEQAPGRLALVTCERFEIYVSGEAAPRVDGPFQGLSGAAAALRLLRVAAGLESRRKGERQILRQVRCAFLEAAEQLALDAVLHALARTALHAGKRIRIETELGRCAPSLVAQALDRLDAEIGGLGGRAVLVVGTGALGAEVAQALGARGVRRLILASRDPGRAALSHAEVAQQLPPVDAVVTCTNARVALGWRSGLARPLVVVDLGAPPNVDAAAAHAAGAGLIGLADLGTTAPDLDLLPAEAIVAEELARFQRWRAARAVRAAA
jgi:glutamyl-tRNA reductase